MKDYRVSTIPFLYWTFNFKKVLKQRSVLIFYLFTCCEKHSNHTRYAAELLKYFEKTFQQLYGIENNVHNLLHLTEDVKVYGSVDNFSAIDFENFLQSKK